MHESGASINALTIPEQSGLTNIHYRVPFSKQRRHRRAQKQYDLLPGIVHRGEHLSPNELKAQGGLRPKTHGQPLKNDSFALQHHQSGRKPTAYTSSTTNFAIALKYSALFRDNASWIYQIKSTPNMINLQNSTTDGYLGLEEEYSALSGILFDQIIRWVPTPHVEKIKGLTPIDTHEKFSRLIPNKTWQRNPNFDPKYKSLRPSPPQPQLVKPAHGRDSSSSY